MAEPPRLPTPPAPHTPPPTHTNAPTSPDRLYQAIGGNTSPNLTRTATNGSRNRRFSTSSRGLHRTGTHLSHKETHRDPNLDVNLPYRTLTEDANLAEYIVEEPSGEIDGGLAADGVSRYKLVTFKPNDPENPKNWSKAYKWYCTMVVAITCFVVAFASSVVTADILGVEKEFNVSEEVALLTITLFVVGFGVGIAPILMFVVSRGLANINQVRWSSLLSLKFSVVVSFTAQPS